MDIQPGAFAFIRFFVPGKSMDHYLPLTKSRINPCISTITYQYRPLLPNFWNEWEFHLK